MKKHRVQNREDCIKEKGRREKELGKKKRV